MPNPKRKHTPSRRDSRRASNWKIEPLNTHACSQCGAAKLPHHVCRSCGFYDGELIVPKKEKTKAEGTEGKK